jgi:hypothetical protein
MSGQPDRGTEGVMATAAQELAVHEKKELVSKDEKTVRAATTSRTPTSMKWMRRSRLLWKCRVWRRRISTFRWKTTCSGWMGRSTSRNMRVWSQSILSTMWGLTSRHCWHDFTEFWCAPAADPTDTPLREWLLYMACRWRALADADQAGVDGSYDESEAQGNVGVNRRTASSERDISLQPGTAPCQ